MPKRPPKYSRHKPTGQARVRIDGKSYYLEKYESPESHKRYETLIARWLSGTFEADRETLTISRLAILFVDHARQYYRRNGKETSEVHSIQTALRPLVKKCGRGKISVFGPRRLKEVRDAMIGLNWARTGINAAVRRITRMLRMPGACIVPAIRTFLSDFAGNLVELNSQIRLKPFDYGCKRGRHNAVSCDQTVVKPGVKVLGQIPNGTITQHVVRATCVKTGWAVSVLTFTMTTECPVCQCPVRDFDFAIASSASWM